MAQPIVRYEQTETYDRFVNEYDTFDNYYDFLVFLAVIGYHEDEIVTGGHTGDSAAGTDGEAGLRNIHSVNRYKTITACLAFQHTGDPNDLVNRELQMEVLSMYASGGLKFVEDRFGDVAGDPTDALLNYIQQSREDRPEGGGLLEEIVESFDDELMENVE